MPVDRAFGPRLLVVDDDALQREAVAAVLTGEGFEVDTAADGPEAIARIRGGRFALALIDYNMPGMNGLTLARVLRTTIGPSRRCPLLGALTASADEPALRQAMQTGLFDLLLRKPLSATRLVAAVAERLGTVPGPARGAAAIHAARLTS